MFVMILPYITKGRGSTMLKWLIVIFTLIAVILLLIAIPRIAKVLFKKSAEGKVITLFNDIEEDSTKAVIDKDDLKDLPHPVRNWLKNSNVIGREMIKTVRLKQEGRMRTKKNGPWMPSKAEQYFTVEEPGFVWIADVKMVPFVHLSGIDTFNAGKGKMNIKVLSIFSVVDSEGPEMDSSTMMRYLAEMMWYPTAALSPYIKWEEIDRNTAKVIMEHEGVSVSGVFYFNENGDIQRFVGKRYKEVNGRYILSDWGGINKEFKEFDGIRIPSKSDVIWFEEDGEFNWFELEITELQYNEPALY
jgi:competence protein ComGC